MVVSVYGSINGRCGESIAPAWTADLDAWTAGHAARYDTMRVGRVARASMADYWSTAETAPAMPPAARDLVCCMNETRKIVFNRTLQDEDKCANSEGADAELATIVPHEPAATW
jgi:hypothetical protein